MPRRALILATGLAALAVISLIGNPWASAQQRPAEPRFAAVPGEKGGQDIFGPYDVQADWPKDLTTLPGHERWTFGAGQSVFAESPNRVFVLQRGELPNLERPKTTKLAPSIDFPIGRLPWRDATTASLPGNGGTGQLAEDGIKVWEARNKLGEDARWEHTILIFDGAGTLIDSWNQWDSMMQRPHYIEYQRRGMGLGADQPRHSLNVQLVIARTDEGRQLDRKLVHSHQFIKERPRTVPGRVEDCGREPPVAPGVLQDRLEQRALLRVPHHAERPRQLITYRQV